MPGNLWDCKVMQFPNFIGEGADEVLMTRTLIGAQRAADSFMARLPREVAEQGDVHESKIVEVDVKKARKSWFGATPEVGPLTPEDEGEDEFDRA